MVQATRFHRGKRLGALDIDDAREMCPVCHSWRPRRPIYRIQRAPDIEMLECAICGAASASHMPKPEILDAYYAEYYSDDASEHNTLDDPFRVARHVLRAIPNLRGSMVLRILDFGGGDGSLAVAIAKLLQSHGNSVPIKIDLVDYSDPLDPGRGDITIDGHRDISTVEGGHDLILASAIFEHIPDAYTAIHQVLDRAGRGAYMYARTPYIVPLARLIPLIDITYPGHVHDMGSLFWCRFLETFGKRGELLSSRPSVAETKFTRSPARTLVAYALKAPARLEQVFLGRNHSPRWSLVGGWEAAMRLD